jgi:uncharacterized protein involved in exopolysaccharide biosynthesis
MKRWLRLASHFYPAAWRRRYATEFDAMLNQVDAGWRDVFDILKGALTMQFTSWNLKTILLTCGLIGVAVAAAAAFSIPSEYQSTAVMLLSGDVFFSEAQKEVLSRTSLEKAITELDLYKARRADTPMENIVQYMRMHDISIKMLRLPAGEKKPTAFTITFDYPDPKLAQAVTRDLLTKFTAALPRYGSLTSLEVLDPPSNPMQPIYPRRAWLLATGLFAGLLVGLTVSYALRWRIQIVRRPAH